MSRLTPWPSTAHAAHLEVVILNDEGVEEGLRVFLQIGTVVCVEGEEVAWPIECDISA